MSLLKKSILLGAAFGVAATLAFAAGEGPTPQQRAVKARQSKMTLYAFNLGLLGGMAKGDIEYDAQAAGLAASNLAALTSIYMPGAWMKGTDNFEMEGTRALPDLWSADPAEVGAKAKTLDDAAQAFAQVAGTDLAGLRGGIGAVGKACGACHKAYRADK